MLVKGCLLWGLQCLRPLAFGTAPLLAEFHGSVPLWGAGAPVPAAPPCCREARILSTLDPPSQRKPGERLQDAGSVQTTEPFLPQASPGETTGLGRESRVCHDTWTLGHCPGAAHHVAAQSDMSKPEVVAQKVGQL